MNISYTILEVLELAASDHMHTDIQIMSELSFPGLPRTLPDIQIVKNIKGKLRQTHVVSWNKPVKFLYELQTHANLDKVYKCCLYGIEW